MFYREAGQFKTSYKADQAIFPILQDKIGLSIIVALAFALPLVSSDFFLNSLMIPFLIFALEVIALKALAVLILGGFTSIPGAIVGGLIIGIGEKVFEVYWGSLFGGGVEAWFAYVLALIFLLFRPQGLFGEKIIERV